MRETFFAIVNPAAGGGRSAKLAGPAIARLRAHGVQVDVIASTGPGHASDLAREAYAQNYRRFIAVGGDGTAHEILNGIFTDAGANFLALTVRIHGTKCSASVCAAADGRNDQSRDFRFER